MEYDKQPSDVVDLHIAFMEAEMKQAKLEKNREVMENERAARMGKK